MKLSRALQLAVNQEITLQGRTLDLDEYISDVDIGGTPAAYSVQFKPDGSVVYITNGWGSDANNRPVVYQYNVPTEWDLGSANLNYLSAAATYTATWSSTYTGGALFFKPDGLFMYIGSYGTKTIYQVPLGTAWDINTAGAVTNTVSMSIPAAFGDMAVSPDGTKIWITNRTSTVYLLNLSTAWDLSTASTGGSITLPTSFSAYGINFITTSGGAYYCYVGTRDVSTVYQYRLSREGDLRTIEVQDSRFLDTCYGVTVALGGNRLYLGSGAGDSYNSGNVAQYYYYVAPYNAADFTTQGGEFTYSSDIIVDVAWDPTGNKAFLLADGSEDQVLQYSASSSFDPSTLTYDSVQITYGSYFISGQGIAWKSDGTVLYITGSSYVLQVPMSTPWTLSPAGGPGFGRYSMPGLQTAQSITWRTDGGRCYISDQTGQVIRQYDLTNPWDVSTASAAGTVATDKQGYSFVQGGTINMAGESYVQAYSGNGSVYRQGDLTTPYDITTLSWGSFIDVDSTQGNLQSVTIVSNPAVSSVEENTLYLVGIDPSEANIKERTR
jgi:hypothetical protein